jgi:hypothetical protein
MPKRRAPLPVAHARLDRPRRPLCFLGTQRTLFLLFEGSDYADPDR